MDIHSLTDGHRSEANPNPTEAARAVFRLKNKYFGHFFRFSRITDVLYLREYPELGKMISTSMKIVLLTRKYFFEKVASKFYTVMYILGDILFFIKI